jgi:hypothetical protein
VSIIFKLVYCATYKRAKEFPSNPYHQLLQTASSNMNPSFVAVYLSNPGDNIIRVEIASANIDMFLSAASIEKINMNIQHQVDPRPDYKEHQVRLNPIPKQMYK